MIGVKLMASSIIDKKSPRLGGRPEHRATDLRGRTRMKRSSLIPEQLSLSSRYFLKRSKIEISHNLKSPARLLGAAPGRPFRCAAFFPYLAMIFRRSGPPPDGLAVASLDFTSCDHGLPFITIQCPLSSGDTAFRGQGHAKRASALAAAINSVATIVLVFINEFLTRLGKLYRYDKADVFRRGYDEHVTASSLLNGFGCTPNLRLCYADLIHVRKCRWSDLPGFGAIRR